MVGRNLQQKRRWMWMCMELLLAGVDWFLKMAGSVRIL